MGLGIEGLQTLAFLTIVFGNQATLYALRERQGVWSWSMPSRWLVLSSVADIAIASTLAARGIVMTSLPVVVVASVLAAAVTLALVANVAKSPVFSRLRIS
jgi:H+-transporting ATPase